MRIIALFLLFLSIISCNKNDTSATLKVGTIAGPETDLVKVAAAVAKQKYGLKIKIIEFNDYNLPNEALNDGSIDANVYQHLPYLEAAKLTRNFDFEIIGRTFVYPMGIYSNKIKNIHELKDNAIVAIPNDPSNETRALLLLKNAGLINIKIKANKMLATIVNNPKHLKIKPLDAAQLPRVLPDVDAAVINTTFAIPAGLNPNHDAIYKENKDSPYANLIVIRTNSTKKQQLDDFVKSFHSFEVKNKAKDLFQDAVISTW